MPWTPKLFAIVIDDGWKAIVVLAGAVLTWLTTWWLTILSKRQALRREVSDADAKTKRDSADADAKAKREGVEFDARMRRDAAADEKQGRFDAIDEYRKLIPELQAIIASHDEKLERIAQENRESQQECERRNRFLTDKLAEMGNRCARAEQYIAMLYAQVRKTVKFPLPPYSPDGSVHEVDLPPEAKT